MTRTLLALALLLIGTAASAQNTITFTASVLQADGQATPALTWSTQPAATGCTASGDWTGAKAPAGTETRPTITSSATYNLTCSWPGNATATLSWTPPTQNTNGSPLTDLAGFKVYWGTVAGVYPNSVALNNPGLLGYVVDQLTPAAWRFTVTAVNARGVESVFSNVATKTTTGSATTNRSVGVVINPVPNAPTSVTVL